MADKNTLRKMSQDVLVIPLSEEDVEILDRFCGKQVEEMTQERLEALILCFLTRERDEELMEAFESFCEDEEYGKEISRTAIIPVLTEYIVLQTIENVESSQESALYSLLLKNALILAVKGKGFVAYPKAIADTFDIYYDYLMDEKTYGKNDEKNEVAQSLLETATESLTEKLNDVDGGVLKSIVYDAATYRYENMVAGIKIDAGSLATSVYDMAKKLVENAPWKYIDRDPAETIKKILGNECNKELMLSEVIENVSEEDEENYLPTSILLRLISGDDEGIELSRETRFKAAELALYLYYELLAEAISDDINETEE